MTGADRIGIDVGGTFTDVVRVVDGRLQVTKVPSTPDAPDAGVIAGLEASSSTASPELDETSLVHGTTVATNAVLEGSWAETALITTAGFRDVLEIGRQDRPALYEIADEKPDPIVPRHRRLAVPERLDEHGQVEEALPEEAIDDVTDTLREQNVDAVAICLLFSFENDTHERVLEEGLEKRGITVPISRSSDVHPEIREYERTTVTALNAALQPVLSTYVDRLRDRLAHPDRPDRLTMMQSNGGTVTATSLGQRPVRALLSGPAAGVVGAAHLAETIEIPDVLTLDMGGTSCDVSLVPSGEPVVSTDVTVGAYPVAVPMIDIHTVGAGGGSIARVDGGGALRVGPTSAGADPGPICYGRGGMEPTVTDANAVLGRLDPERVGTGEPVNGRELSTAVLESLEPGFGGDHFEAAAGILRVAEATMSRALRVVSVERGYDPREFGLVAFGGAGPLHAAALAAELGIERVVIPPSAGVFSAYGLLAADRVTERSLSHVRPLSKLDPTAIEDRYVELETESRQRLQDEGIPADELEVERRAELRYRGQAYEVPVPVPTPVDSDARSTIRARYHERHEQRYGHQAPDEPIELVTLRVRARKASTPPPLVHAGPDTGSLSSAQRTTRDVWFDGTMRSTPIYDRATIPVESTLEGPAIVEAPDTTAVVPPGDDLHVHESGTLLLEVDP